MIRSLHLMPQIFDCAFFDAISLLSRSCMPKYVTLACSWNLDADAMTNLTVDFDHNMNQNRLFMSLSLERLR